MAAYLTVMLIEELEQRVPGLQITCDLAWDVNKQTKGKRERKEKQVVHSQAFIIVGG